MDCPQVLENLSAHLDGALDPATRQELEEHLRSCGSCRSELDALRACVEAVNSMVRISAPPGFLAQVHERMREGSAWSRFIGKLTVPRRVKLPLHAAGAVAAVILILLMVPMRETAKKSPQIPQQTTLETPVEAPRPAQPPQFAQKAPRDSGIATGKPGPEGSPPGKENGVIELVLVMGPSRQGMSGGLEQSSRRAPQPPASLKGKAAETRPAPAPEAADAQSLTSGAVKREIQVDSPKERTPEKAQPQERERAVPGVSRGRALGERDSGTPFSQVEEVIRRAGGTVTSTEPDPATGRPRSLLALIPRARYPDLVSMLREKGRLQGLPSEISLQGPERTLHIRVRLDYTTE